MSGRREQRGPFKGASALSPVSQHCDMRMPATNQYEIVRLAHAQALFCVRSVPPGFAGDAIKSMKSRSYVDEKDAIRIAPRAGLCVQVQVSFAQLGARAHCPVALLIVEIELCQPLNTCMLCMSCWNLAAIFALDLTGGCALSSRDRRIVQPYQTPQTWRCDAPNGS